LAGVLGGRMGGNEVVAEGAALPRVIAPADEPKRL
jgi:hypothetical protein